LRPAAIPIEVNCIAIIVPLLCCLGSLAIVFDNLSGHPPMASRSLTIIVHNTQASLGESELSGLCKEERAGGIVFDPWKRHGDPC
jgi:hypothetical protein